MSVVALMEVGYIGIPKLQYEAMRARIDAQDRELALLRRRMDDLEVGARRYRLVRTLNVREFSEIYVDNLDGKGVFDGLVDKLIAKRGGCG